MGLFDFFSLPSRVKEVERQCKELEKEKTNLLAGVKYLREEHEKLEKEFILYQGKVDLVEKYFTSQPAKNDIETQGPDEVELNENSRFPMMDGLKIQYEDEPAESAFPVRIYGSGQNQQKAE